MKIGITGTIGSGKTTVSQYLRARGFYVFDCDEYNAKLLTRKSVIKKIGLKFPEVIKNDSIDKKLLANIIFNDSKLKKELEDILHPLIIKQMNKEANKHDIFFGEVPLLFESNLDNEFDHIILVVCDEYIAIERLKQRGFSKKEAKERIKNQMDVQTKIKRADEILYNNCDLAKLYKNVDKWITKYVG